MPLSLEHTCAACGARIAIRGARAYTPLPCPSCGKTFRVRTEIGGYHLGEVLARSGLGVIFRARDQGGAEIAVKVLQPPYAAEPVDVEYFASEVWVLARLNHPYCLRIFATGVDQGLAWIAMEWLAHGSLAVRLATRGKLREAEVLAIGLQAAGALSAAQAAGHPHRDVAAENLVFADPRTIKVTDFGQSSLYQIAASDLGVMCGRACTVPPERMRGEPEEAHSDIYSLGTVLFHALTGSPLHDGEPHPQITLELLESRPLRVQEFAPGIHERTALVLDKMLAAEPSQRFQHWGEVVTQLAQAGTLVARRDAPAAAEASPKPVPRRRRAQPRSIGLGRILAFFTVVATIAGLAGFVLWKRQTVAAPEQPTRPVTTPASPPPSR